MSVRYSDVEDKEGLWEKISYTWVIPDANFLFYYSPRRKNHVFYSRDRKCAWEIAIDASKPAPENERQLRLLLNLIMMPASPVDVKGTLVVSNSGDYVISQGSGQNRFTIPGMVWNCNQILHWVNFKPLIPDKKLKITTEVLMKICDSEKKIDLTLTQSSDSPGVTLQKSMCDLFESSAFTDVVFKVKEAELKAHKCILSTRSPVFAAMFTHECIEKDTGVVKIVDFDSNIFTRFLRFVYSGEVDLPSVEIAMELIRAAEKYDFPDLKFLSSKYITANLNVGNVGSILLFADNVGAEDLKRIATDYILRNAESSSNDKREAYELIGKANPKLLADLLMAAEVNISKHKSAHKIE